MLTLLKKRLERLRYQMPRRLFPPLAKLMLKYATRDAVKKLSEEGPITILIDNTVLDISVTHETKWITTNFQHIGGHEHHAGHLARVPVHGIKNDSDRYRQTTFLAGLTHLARLGHINFVTSAELKDEQFRQPMGRYRGYGLFDRSLFAGLPIPSIDGHVFPTIGPPWMALPSAGEQQRARIRGRRDELFEKLYKLMSQQLGKKCSQDCWHIRTAEVHGCFAFLTTDSTLLKAWGSLAKKEPIRSLKTRVLSPSQLGEMLKIHPVPPVLLSYEGDALVRVDTTMPGERRRPVGRYRRS